MNTPLTALPIHRLDVPAPEDLPFAIGTFDTIGALSRANFPHRHHFYEVVLVDRGEGAHVVDFTEDPLAPPHLCVISPGQVHFWERPASLHGWVILFSEEFLLAHPGDRDVLHALGGRAQLRLDGSAATRITTLVTEMDREYRRRDADFITVLQAYLHVLLICARRLPGATRPASPGGRGATVATRFARMVAEHPGRIQRSVPAYAARLGVSASYLNEVVRDATGHTPAQLIRRVQVLEAKRLLALTSLTVNQVARELDFVDPAYFCRFFRRETGQSPGEFRLRAVEKHHASPIESIDHSESRS